LGEGGGQSYIKSQVYEVKIWIREYLTECIHEKCAALDNNVAMLRHVHITFTHHIEKSFAEREQH
jgi:hypothetical protein